jgi:hypothetical protein
MLGNRNGPRLRVRSAGGKLSEYGAAVPERQLKVADIGKAYTRNNPLSERTMRALLELRMTTDGVR